MSHWGNAFLESQVRPSLLYGHVVSFFQMPSKDETVAITPRASHPSCQVFKIRVTIKLDDNQEL